MTFSDSRKILIIFIHFIYQFLSDKIRTLEHGLEHGITRKMHVLYKYAHGVLK